MPVGRPPAPIEHHRRVGRANGKKADGRPMPLIGEIAVIPQADGTPDFPTDLGDDGRYLWRQIWQQGIVWISPHSDRRAAEEACRVADDLAAARKRYRATTDPADARALVAVGKRFDEALASLAFTPASRARLGVAEVVAASKLDALRRRQSG